MSKQTMGFENHVHDNVTVFDARSSISLHAFDSIVDDDTLRIVACQPEARLAGRVHQHVALGLTRTEAIFLRNRLTAFIEKGLTDQS
jgi:hypothetical protein